MRDVDRIIDLMMRSCPDLEVRQLSVSNPRDDDGLWFFRRPSSVFEVQIESASGMCPFLIETDENDKRVNAHTVENAVEVLSALLHL
jgi:hypothetical protein